MTAGPLAGLRVVELSAFVAVPLAGATLAGLGADVIRVDPLGGGVDIDRAPTWRGVSLYWAGLNAGKRSMTMDLDRPEGQQLVLRLLASGGEGGGILITNLAARGWTSYERLRETRPDLIMVALSGTVDGLTAVDYTVNAELGFPYVTGPEDWAGPINHVLPAWDGMAGLTIATAVLAAERHRRETAAGQLVELALTDIGLAFTARLGIFSEARLDPMPRTRHGNYVFGTFGRDFRTLDGRDLILVAVTRHQWDRLISATGLRAEVAAVERSTGVDLREEAARWAQRRQIADHLQQWVGRHTLAECATAFDGNGVLWRAYRTFKETDANPPPNRGLAEVEHPLLGTITGARSPVAFGAFPDAPVPKSLVLGQHTHEVLSEALGLSPAEIDALETEGVIRGADAPGS